MADDQAQLQALLDDLRQDLDEATLLKLYDHTSPTVYAWATLLLPQPAAERVVVATYTAVWREATRYQSRVEPWAWLLCHTAQALRAERHRCHDDQNQRR